MKWVNTYSHKNLAFNTNLRNLSMWQALFSEFRQDMLRYSNDMVCLSQGLAHALLPKRKTCSRVSGFPEGPRPLGLEGESDMEAGEESGPGNGREFGDDEKMGQLPQPLHPLSSFSSVWTTCVLRPRCGWPGGCQGALALASQPALWGDPHLWRFPHQ